MNIVLLMLQNIWEFCLVNESFIEEGIVYILQQQLELSGERVWKCRRFCVFTLNGYVVMWNKSCQPVFATL